mgnify:FL=1|jgi:hypothetical protein
MDIEKNINSIFSSVDHKDTYNRWMILCCVFIKLLFFNIK